MSGRIDPRTAAEAATTAAAAAAAAVVATTLAVDLAKIGFRIEKIEDIVKQLEESSTSAQIKLDAINEAANRWKGGFLVVIALGGVIGWLSSVGGNIFKAFK